MVNLQSGDRIELSDEDTPATKIRATLGRLLSDRDEGMGSELEDYTACWIEITVDEPSDMDANQVDLKNPSQPPQWSIWTCLPCAFTE